MIIWPVRLPVSVGVNFTWMVQVLPTGTVTFWQLSVSLKSPLMVIVVGKSARLPVFSRDTGCVPLAVPNSWLAKDSTSGFAVAVVIAVPAVHSGVSHTPRP